MAHDVFISYSHLDKNTADAVCSILEQKGIRCWIAPRDITPGTPFAEGIINGITSSKVFILVYSSNSNHSSQVIKEVDRAVHHGLAIIPLRLEDVPLSKQLEYYISDVHWLDALTPPLEKYIKKLCDVIRLLLKMDEINSDNVREAFETETVKGQKPVRTDRTRRLTRFRIPVITLIFLALGISAVWIFRHQANVRWARKSAIPEIERLIDENDVWRNLVEPYRLAEKAEKILGDDAELAELFSKISLKIVIKTDPPGAKVFMKEYVKPDEDWSFLGITPLEKIRVPVGIFRWKLEQDGYDTVFAAASSWKSGSTEGKPGTVLPNDLFRKLDKTGSIPENLVRVASTETPLGTLGDFFIGRYEVSNREYKEFVDAGGYRNIEYWEHPFLNGDQLLAWEEAMKMFVDKSGLPGPSTWMGGDFPPDQGDFPVSGLCWYEASAYAKYKGMALPTSTHWNVARGGMTPMIRVPQLGGFGIFAPFSNIGGKSAPVKVGSLDNITSYGAFDMAGNVREWCWNEIKNGRAIRGGSWEDNNYEFGNVRQAPAMDRSQRNGIRLAFYPDSGSIPDTVLAIQMIPELADVRLQKPVPDDIFKIYREQFSYDPGELNANIDYRTESPGGWIREKISFDAAYGGEKVSIYLFLPLNVKPPCQAVIYFPGSASLGTPSSDDIENYYEFPMFLSFLVRNGRAVIYPVYKGTFERRKPELTQIHIGTNNFAFTEYLIQLVKDFRRCIDYLETRPDIDTSKVAFYGMSWGGLIGPIVTAVENRLKASVLISGGLMYRITRPEANSINYVTHIQIPTIMLNGEYDIGIDSYIRPLFELLGTPKENKQLVLYETDHIPPRADFIRETLTWLDKYMGPVK